jgi:predicted deacylase
MTAVIELEFDELSDACVAAGEALGMTISRLSNGAPVLRKDAPAPVLSLLSGLHGDERSGPLFLKMLLEEWRADPGRMPNVGLLVVPVLNDVGWDQRGRLWNGKDLNQQFAAETDCQVARDLMEVYSDAPPAFHWDLHEDDEVNCEYVFEYEQDTHDFSRRLASHLGCRTERWSKPDSSSECFVRSLGVRHVVTTEANPATPFAARFQWLRRAFDFVAREVASVPAR